LFDKFQKSFDSTRQKVMWIILIGLLNDVGWHRSCVPSWRMYAGYRCWLPSSAVCWQSNVLGQEITQPVRWPLFCHRRANTAVWDSLPEQLWQLDITFGQFKRLLKMFMFD